MDYWNPKKVQCHFFVGLKNGHGSTAMVCIPHSRLLGYFVCKNIREYHQQDFTKQFQKPRSQKKSVEEPSDYSHCIFSAGGIRIEKKYHSAVSKPLGDSVFLGMRKLHGYVLTGEELANGRYDGFLAALKSAWKEPSFDKTFSLLPWCRVGHKTLQ